MNKEDKNTAKQVLKAKIPPPDTQSWHEYSWQIQQHVPNRIEDAAKFLATMISISLTIFFAAFNLLPKDASNNAIWLLLTIAFWMTALFLAFFVLFPEKYRFKSQSAESIKKMQAEIVRTKSRRLLAAMVLYFVPFGILLVVFMLNLYLLNKIR